MPSLTSLPIRTQLAAGLAAVVALLSVLGLSALWSLGSVDAGVTTLSDDIVPSLVQVDAVATGTQAVREAQYRHLAAATAKRKAKVAIELTGDEAAVDRAFSRHRSLIGDDAAALRPADSVRASWRAYLKRTRAFVKTSRDNRVRATTILDDAGPSRDRLDAAIAAWRKQTLAKANGVAQSSHATFRRSGKTSLAITVLAVLLAAGVALLIGRVETSGAEPTGPQATGPEGTHLQATQLEATGSEATQPEATEPEREAESAAANPASVETQPAPLVDPSEIASAVGTIAERGRTIDDPIPEDPVQSLTTAERIGEIVHTIGSLVEKANLLAMQTGVEADRAGEASPGFTVVADGVRRLADDSQAAAGRIASSIEAIQASPSFEGIAGVTGTIMDLAEETRQIGTDAAIEGARAGDAGSRFANIAIEIGQLADEFQAAGDRLSSLVDEIPSGTGSVQPEAQLIGS